MLQNIINILFQFRPWYDPHYLDSSQPYLVEISTHQRQLYMIPKSININFVEKNRS